MLSGYGLAQPNGCLRASGLGLERLCGWLAHLYVFCKGGDSCCRLCGSHLGLATLIDSHRALFPGSVLRDPITARLARPPIALHHGACAALVPIREPLTTFFLNPVHHCDNVKV